MKGHDHAAFLCHRNHLLQENLNIFPKPLFSQLSISLDQSADLLLCVAGIPAGQMDIVLQRIQSLHLLPVHHQTGGAVRRLLIQLGSCPVKDRHEIIGHALHTVFRTAPHILTVRFQMRVSLLRSQLDVLGHRNGLHHVKHQTVRLTVRLHLRQRFLRPDLTRLHVIHCGHD